LTDASVFQLSGNYLTNASLFQNAGNYLTTFTPLSGTYLSIIDANNTLGSYLTVSGATSLYQPVGSYLTTATASATYQPIANMLNYQSKFWVAFEYLNTGPAVNNFGQVNITTGSISTSQSGNYLNHNACPSKRGQLWYYDSVSSCGYSLCEL
jgi:hypothetical protein